MSHPAVIIHVRDLCCRGRQGRAHRPPVRDLCGGAATVAGVGERVEYLLRTGALSDEELDAVCGRMLALVADDVDALECDIPWADREQWPTAVVEAAEILMQVRPPRHSDPAYWQTGVVRPVPRAVWEAFVTFLPYSYDASCWAAGRGAQIVSVSDGLSSFLVALRAEQVEDLDPQIARLLDPYVRRRRRSRRG